jgi:hypothetical protein
MFSHPEQVNIPAELSVEQGNDAAATGLAITRKQRTIRRIFRIQVNSVREYYCFPFYFSNRVDGEVEAILPGSVPGS